MPDDRSPARTQRDDTERRRDHAEIERLADDVLPALIGRLAAGRLGELEVREDSWRIRLRRPAPPPPRPGEQRPERPERGERPVRPGAAHHPPGDQRPRERDAQATRPGSGPVPGPGPSEGNGRGPGQKVGRSGRPGATGGAAAGAGADGVAEAARPQLVATSPAVGIFRPRADVRPGSRVRGGDRLAAVDLLGVPQDVVAPDDGIVADTLVGPGESVEYGQDLILLEPAHGPRPSPRGQPDGVGSDGRDD